MQESDGRPHRHSGGCQCGRLRFALHADPLEVQICHCRMCQKATGGPFAALVMVRRTDMSWTRGTPDTFQSSTLAFRDFCGTCGTPLTYRYAEGDTVDLTLGSFDNPRALTPQCEYGVQSRMEWLSTLGHLPEKTTEEHMKENAVGPIESFQHPDHDT